jgi:hypothetical protein
LRWLIAPVAGIAATLAFAAPAGALPPAGLLPTTGLHSVTTLTNTIHSLRGCLSYMSATKRALLVARFGVGGGTGETEAQIAATDGTAAATVYSDELNDVRRLIEIHGRKGCAAAVVTSTASTTAATTATVTSTAATPTTSASTPAAVSAPSSSSPGRGGTVALIIAIAGAVFLVEESVRRGVLARRRP